MVARRRWTRLWWDKCSGEYELVTSTAVLEEIERGSFPQRDEVIKLISSVPFITLDDAVAEIAETYVHHRVMPEDPRGDALHLALASHHKCDFLLTWNCRHLANANKTQHIRRVNALMGLHCPTLVTPLGLLGEEEEDDS